MDSVNTAVGGSSVGMVEGCAVVTGSLKGVEFFVMTAVFVQVSLVEFIIFNYTYITNI